MRFVDSHLHLTRTDAGSLIPLAAANRTLLVTCGVDRQTSDEGLALSRENPGRVRPFVGVHPSEVPRSPDIGWLGPMLARAAGLGEVGLDPTYPSGGKEGAQLEAFESQLALAEKLAKPVQVHSRDAEKTSLEVLGGFRLRGVLMHWLESEEALAGALDRGFYVSFGPAILYSKKLQRMASRAPADRVLTESDSPVQYRPLGGVHGSHLIPSVVLRLSQLWGVGFEDCRAGLAENAARFFGPFEKG